MPMPADELKQMIVTALPGAHVDIVDLAGDQDHYAATIVSEKFQGLSMVQQHQLVYKALQGKMGTVLHALSLTTKIPE